MCNFVTHNHTFLWNNLSIYLRSAHYLLFLKLIYVNTYCVNMVNFCVLHVTIITWDTVVSSAMRLHNI